MMSSCCTFRLKRRNAFSSGSPSCTRTSANELHLQTYQWGHFLEYGKLIRTSQGIPAAPDGMDWLRGKINGFCPRIRENQRRELPHFRCKSHLSRYSSNLSDTQ